MKKVKFISLLLAIVFSFSSFAMPVTAFADNSCIKGIDVSEHNTDTDFAMLKSQGFDFVMIRIGYFNHIDKLFYENVSKACAAGMSFGVYLYSYAFTDEEAQIEADFVVNTLSTLPEQYKQNMTLPVAYDLEDKQIIENGCGYNEITQHALIFTNTIRANGYDTMVYANNNWFENYIDTALLYQYGVKLWYAYHTEDESASVKTIGNTLLPCTMWQYSSGSSNELGLDLNLLYVAEELPQQALPTDTPSVEPTAVVQVKKPSKPTVSSIKSSKKKELKLVWKKKSSISGYQLQYSTSSKFTKSKTKTVSVNKKNTSKTIKSLKSGKKYYVRLRVYKTVDGKKVYSPWSKVKSVKVK